MCSRTLQVAESEVESRADSHGSLHVTNARSRDVREMAERSIDSKTYCLSSGRDFNIAATLL